MESNKGKPETRVSFLWVIRQMVELVDNLSPLYG